MILAFNPTTRQASVPVNGVTTFLAQVDEHGQSHISTVNNQVHTAIASLRDYRVMAEVIHGIYLAKRGMANTLFSDCDPDEASTVVYLAIPKDLNKHDVVLTQDYESLSHATDLLIEGVLENLYQLTVDDNVL